MKLFQYGKHTRAFQFLIYIFCWIISNSCVNPQRSLKLSPRVVRTVYGPLRGVLLDQPIGGGGTMGGIEAFFGINYATVQEGNLRFMPPTSTMQKWDEVKEASEPGPAFPQPMPDLRELSKRMPRSRVEHFHRIMPHIEKQSEECLNLNVYVPIDAFTVTESKELKPCLASEGRSYVALDTFREFVENNSTRPLLPVLLFIHGESYSVGSGNAYDGRVLASVGQIIVITLNYRLGALGFLTTQDSDAQGNYALLDQVAALHWIQANIRHFGGDPSRLTLLGHGHGAAMVNLLAITPLTRGSGLFRRITLQSGAALSSPWTLSRRPLQYTYALARAFNCTPSTGPPVSHSNLVRCLKKIPAQNLVKQKLDPPAPYLSSFGPTVDGRSVLPVDLRTMAEDPAPDSVFSSVDALLGVTQNEAFGYFNQTEVDGVMTAGSLARIINTYVNNVYKRHQHYISDVIKHQYQEWPPRNDVMAARDLSMQILGDALHVAPAIDAARTHATVSLNGSSTFFYCFKHTSRAETEAAQLEGSQGDDLAFVFGAPLTSERLSPFPSAFSRADRDLSAIVIRYWSNFIRNGNPNVGSPTEEVGRKGSGPSAPGPLGSKALGGGGSPLLLLRDSIQWPQYDPVRQEYLSFESRPVSRHHYRTSKMALWLDLIPKLYRSDISLPEHINHKNSVWGNKNLDNDPLFELEEEFPDHNDEIQKSFISSTKKSENQDGVDVLDDAEDNRRDNLIIDRAKYIDDPKLYPAASELPRSNEKRNHAEISTQNPAQAVFLATAQPSVRIVTPKSVTSSKKGNTSQIPLTSFGLTILVGCVLLLLNVGLFCAAYCRHTKHKKYHEQRIGMLKDVMQDPSNCALRQLDGGSALRQADEYTSCLMGPSGDLGAQCETETEFESVFQSNYPPRDGGSEFQTSGYSRGVGYNNQAQDSSDSQLRRDLKSSLKQGHNRTLSSLPSSSNASSRSDHQFRTMPLIDISAPNCERLENQCDYYRSNNRQSLSRDVIFEKNAQNSHQRDFQNPQPGESQQQTTDSSCSSRSEYRTAVGLS